MTMHANHTDRNVTSAAQKTTLLDLVFALRTTVGAREDVIVAAARDQVRSGRAQLCGIYAGVRNRWAI